MKFSYCESLNANSISPWHIRKLSDQGKKLGGGVDTKSLCGRDVSWDLKSEVNSFDSDRICNTCLTIYKTELNKLFKK